MFVTSRVLSSLDLSCGSIAYKYKPLSDADPLISGYYVFKSHLGWEWSSERVTFRFGDKLLNGSAFLTTFNTPGRMTLKGTTFQEYETSAAFILVLYVAKRECCILFCEQFLK